MIQKGVSLRPIMSLQPTQLFINREKLAVLQARVDFSCDQNIPPVPVKLLDGRWVLTDGHTRALAAHLAGLRQMPVVLDNDPLDWDAYRICVDWCLAVGITTIADLVDRMLTAEDYEEKWLSRCRRMQQDLADRRKASP